MTVFEIEANQGQSDYYSTVKMKTLSDFCLKSIGENLELISQVRRYLPTPHKQILLERLVSHDMLTPERLPHITYNLFSEKLTHINFYKSVQITDNILKQFGASLCKLEWITIHGCKMVTDAGIAHITENQTELVCLELRKLNLSKKCFLKTSSEKLKKVDLRGSLMLDQAVIALVENNPSINHLILVHCLKLTDKVLPVIATQLNKQLKHLDIEDLKGTSDASIRCLAENCPNLMKLNIGVCNQVTDSGMGHVFALCRQLTYLNLSYCSDQLANNQVLKEIPQSIVELSLCGAFIKDVSLFTEMLTRLHNIRALCLCGVIALNDTTLETLLSVVGGQLELLDVGGSPLVAITDTGLKAVTKYCTKIRCYNRHWTEGSYQVLYTDQGELELVGGSPLVAVTDTGLKAVTKYCTQIRVLELWLLEEITGVTLLPLLKDDERAQIITNLSLSCRKFDQFVLGQVVLTCVNLENLNLGGMVGVDDVLLATLAENCRHLHSINIKGCTKVSDEGVCLLARYCPLVVAIFSGLRLITDKSVFAMANCCPYLEEIYLSGCYGVTEAAIRYLLDTCIPRVYYTHRTPNANPDAMMARNLDTGEFQRVVVVP